MNIQRTFRNNIFITNMFLFFSKPSVALHGASLIDNTRKPLQQKRNVCKLLFCLTELHISYSTTPHYCQSSIVIIFGFLRVTNCISTTNLQSVNDSENPSFLWSLLEKYHHETVSLKRGEKNKSVVNMKQHLIVQYSAGH